MDPLLVAWPSARLYQEGLLNTLHSHLCVRRAAECEPSLRSWPPRRLELLATDAPDEDLEYTLGRQLEEEIRMCENELGLIPKMAGEWAGQAWVLGLVRRVQGSCSRNVRRAPRAMWLHAVQRGARCENHLRIERGQVQAASGAECRLPLG